MLKINNTESIKELKNQDCSVNITHFRRFGDITMPVFLAKQLKKSGQNIPPVSNSGGFTVGVVKKRGIKYTAISKCCDTDPFNYRMGTMIVINRIKDQIDKFSDL